MNQTILDEWQEGFEEMTDSLGETFVISGETFTGVISDTEFASPLADLGGGTMADLGVTIVVSKAVMTSAPAIGALLLVRGKRGKVIQTKDDAISVTIVAATSDK